MAQLKLSKTQWEWLARVAKFNDRGKFCFVPPLTAIELVSDGLISSTTEWLKYDLTPAGRAALAQTTADDDPMPYDPADPKITSLDDYERAQRWHDRHPEYKPGRVALPYPVATAATPAPVTPAELVDALTSAVCVIEDMITDALVGSNVNLSFYQTKFAEIEKVLARRQEAK